MAKHAEAATLLEVKNLSIGTKTRTLVSDFNLSMAPGDRVGLIGESGSGKSITTSALMGLLPEGVTAQGSIQLAGYGGNLVEASDRELQKIRGKDMAMVFQEPLTALNPLMKVGPQVAEIMSSHKTVPSKAAARARAVQMLESVKLPDPERAARSYPHQLSGGQRQRAMLAMALANNPGLLLCDEPTTALDVTVQRQVLDLILESVTERGTGLLFITHDLSVVANVCDRVLVMNNGRVVEEGSTEEVFSNPQHPYTRGLLAASDLDATDAQGRLFTVASAAAYVPPSVREEPAPAERVPEEPVAAPPEPATVGEAEPAAQGEPSENPVISVADLHRIYPVSRSTLFGKPSEVHALRGVSFEVAAGQRFGVVGESGSGKSTLLRILAGLDQPSSGSVQVAGNQVSGAKERDLLQLRQQLQIVFQDPMGSLDPRMRVRDIIAEPLLAPGQKVDSAKLRKQVAEMLGAVGLPADAAERFPHQFSGGQRQRISIARALICEPRVLVADEPVSALDVSVRAQVLNLLSDLVDDYQLTLVFVSHDLGVVRYICDNVVVMNEGQIVESGTTEQIYENPQHEYTRTLVNSSMSLQNELALR
ncbi:glutathione ABC transporter ATP-binding protein [Arthrobacter sp. MYb224]|uniref:dipeptide ABC transporter ATP-binding protein n=1 Tax=Micrococcaceae TaxID=1268 RepID=UPI000CFC52F0|nr:MULTISPECIES: ABC transporter ATP-binding protein [unclassified Arthrobacter]PRA00312.1 glutathione ABC transporter ATP-binding protein [Arthrobacter sp. MYb224]PRA04503.1 glutathione ABC transporter ATP-binding protein [Arthrobacter sp. MYb229]PRB51584.1 glutathione ABC transporter ATP-binding protein [Arthrobacter sp. MYb216]